MKRGGDEAADTKGLSRASLTLETWKVGWTLMDWGFSLTAAGLTLFSISKGPMSLGASFLDSTQRGRSQVDSHTFWPTW